VGGQCAGENTAFAPKGAYRNDGGRVVNAGQIARRWLGEECGSNGTANAGALRGYCPLTQSPASRPNPVANRCAQIAERTLGFGTGKVGFYWVLYTIVSKKPVFIRHGMSPLQAPQPSANRDY
jgi:hypothetical protein